MTEPKLTLTPEARDWVLAQGGVLTVRAAPRNGCCGGQAAVPQAEAGSPEVPGGHDCFVVEGVRVHLARTLDPGPWRVELEGFRRWHRLAVTGPVSAWRTRS